MRNAGRVPTATRMICPLRAWGKAARIGLLIVALATACLFGCPVPSGDTGDGGGGGGKSGGSTLTWDEGTWDSSSWG